MLNTVGNVLLVVVLIATLKEYKELQRKNEEVSVLLENTIRTKKTVDSKCRKLIADVIYLTKVSQDIINKYDIREEELSKARNLFNKSKRYRIRKKAAKRLIKGE